MNGPESADPTRTVDHLTPSADPEATPTHPSNGTPRGEPSTQPHLSATGEAGGGSWQATAADRYRIIEHHKSGGLGQVWKAEDTAFGRMVALKTIRPDRTWSSNLVSRFVREAKATGKLEHPGIVPVYDHGERDGAPFYAMRFIDGQTLEEAVKVFHGVREAGAAPKLDLRGLLDRFLGVCHAIAFAHDSDYLHRDLKGSNVILGDFHEVFVLDWGLVKKVGEPDQPGDPDPLSPDVDPPTRTGAILGTPAYMSPEVADQQPATTASDIYGLGAVLYHILTCHPPAERSSDAETLEMLRSGTPAPPLPRKLNPGVSPALEAICRKALSRSPADRYPSADALAYDVRRWLADEPVSAYPEPWPVRAGRWARRHRTAVTAAAMALVLTTVGSAVSAGLIWRERDRTETILGVALEFGNSVSDVVTATETGQTVERRKELLDRTVKDTESLLTALPGEPILRTRLARLLRYSANLVESHSVSCPRGDRPE